MFWDLFHEPLAEWTNNEISETSKIFVRKYLQETETVSRRCSVKKVVWEVLQNSLENIRARVSFIKKEKLALIFSCEFRETFKNLFYRTPPGDRFYISKYLGKWNYSKIWETSKIFGSVARCYCAIISLPLAMKLNRAILFHSLVTMLLLLSNSTFSG